MRFVDESVLLALIGSKLFYINAATLSDISGFMALVFVEKNIIFTFYCFFHFCITKICLSFI